MTPALSREPPRDRKDAALTIAIKALRGIDTFAWSSMQADCAASMREGNRRIEACRKALADIAELRHGR